jgi:hypothetical protein
VSSDHGVIANKPLVPTANPLARVGAHAGGATAALGNEGSMRIEEKDSVLELIVTEDGSGDFLVAIEARSEGFSGHADGHVVGDAWRAFVRQLAILEAERKGTARLISVMPGEFDLEVKASDGRGHMGVSGVLAYRRVGVGDWPVQQLSFAFEFDPSKLLAFASAAASTQSAARERVNTAREW